MSAFQWLPSSLCSEDALIMRTRVPFRARGDYQLFDILDFHSLVAYLERRDRWSVQARHVNRAYRGLHWREIT